MKRGPKPMPRNLRLVTGAGPARLRDEPANPVPEPPVKIPDPPAYLTANELDCFVVNARKFAGMRIMTDADVDLLVMYVRNWLDAQEANARVLESGMIVKSPKGYPIYNPWYTLRCKAEANCQRILSEFGVTPTTRNRASA